MVLISWYEYFIKIGSYLNIFYSLPLIIYKIYLSKKFVIKFAFFLLISYISSLKQNSTERIKMLLHIILAINNLI